VLAVSYIFLFEPCASFFLISSFATKDESAKYVRKCILDPMDAAEKAAREEADAQDERRDQEDHTEE
jgi:hypothetical protein